MPRITLDLTDEQAKHLRALGSLYNEQSIEIIAGQLMGVAVEKAAQGFKDMFDPEKLGGTEPWDEQAFRQDMREVIAAASKGSRQAVKRAGEAA